MSSDNGVLLRVDLHLLFDANLLHFHVEDARVFARFDSSVLTDNHYAAFEGREILGLPPTVIESLRARAQRSSLVVASEPPAPARGT